MKNKSKQNSKGFDKDFDDNNILIDFSQSTHTDGLSKVIKLAPLTIPAWLNAEIESIAQMQANSKSSVIRQLLVEALSLRQDRLRTT